MGRGTNRLSAKFVSGKPAPGRYADGAGLYLKVDKNGLKKWTLRYTLNGELREMGLGSAGPNQVGLADARDLADAARELVKKGEDPIEARKAAPIEPPVVRTFHQVAKALAADLRGGWKNAKHAKQWLSSLERHAKPLLPLTPAEIVTEQVLEVLRPIWRSRGETASRVRGRIEHVLDAARVGGEIVGPWENPARWRGHLARLLPKRKVLARGHHRAMPFRKAPAFMAELRQRVALAAQALELTILAVTRTEETLGAKWKEFDLDHSLWTIPPERMKGGREHRVYLSKRAVELLREIARGSNCAPDDWVFPGQRMGKKLSNMSMTMVLRRMKVDGATVHGFRSTFRDWVGETTNFPDSLAEAALAHVKGDKVERAYRRGDAFMRRGKMMEAWADYLSRPVVASATVTPLRGAG